MPMPINLRSAVLDFAEQTYGLSNAELDTIWQWRGYDEGIRFAFFRVYEELRWLAAQLSAEASLSAAQQALIQHHAAYWDLRAVLLYLDDATLDDLPGKDMWTIRKILSHMIETEWSFTLVNDFALQRSRRGEPGVGKIPDEAWDVHFIERGGFKENLFQGSLGNILEFYDELHNKVFDILVQVSVEELKLLAEFWEPQPMEIAFRLIRYDSHLVQHTIQVEKNLELLGHPLTEVKRLHRRIFNALAVAEGLCFAMECDLESSKETAGYIERLTGEISPLIHPT